MGRVGEEAAFFVNGMMVDGMMSKKSKQQKLIQHALRPR